MTDPAQKPVRIGIVAGEASGDRLGAGLMAALTAQRPDISFLGAGGPAMRAAGLDCRIRSERLTMNGFIEPLLRLPGLLRARRRLRNDFARAGICGFIGIDFNGFNLVLARDLKRRGIPTSQFVSPAVYAWRSERLRHFHRALDQVLALYPFEPPLYVDSGVEAVFVGHPLADTLAEPPSRAQLRAEFVASGGADADCVVAVLPGSRPGELARMLDPFLDAVARVQTAQPDCLALIAAVDAPAAARIEAVLRRDYPNVRARVVTERATDVLAAADLALVKSGTGTLEAMLLGVPMVVAYRLDPVSAWLVRSRLRTPWVALPNILAGEALVPEFLQEAVTGEALAEALMAQRPRSAWLRGRFAELAGTLSRGASHRAATAFLDLLARREALS